MVVSFAATTAPLARAAPTLTAVAIAAGAAIVVAVTAGVTVVAGTAAALFRRLGVHGVMVAAVLATGSTGVAGLETLLAAAVAHDELST